MSSPPPVSPSSRESAPVSAWAGRTRLLLWIALAAGLALRLAILSQTAELGTRITDEQDYATLARNIVAGDGLAWGPGRPTSIRPPLYPALVAGAWTITGVDHFQAIRFLQIGLTVVLVFLTRTLGRRLFNPVVGDLSAVIVWWYPSLIVANFLILTETLFTLLLLAWIRLAIETVDRPRLMSALFCGVTLGLAALTRSILWPMPLVLCPLVAWLVGAPWSRRLAIPAVLFAGYAVVVGPWAVRNTRLQHVVEIVDTMGGLNLRMGNYEYTPEERMWDAVSLQGEKNWVYAMTQEAGLPNPITEGQKDKWAQKKAIQYILANPGTTLRRDAIKFADLWGLEREFIAGVQQGLFHPPAWFAIVASIVILAGYVAVVLPGAMGLWLVRNDWPSHLVAVLPIVVITGLHSLVFGHSRYHLPLMPLLAIYAAALVTSWPAAWQHAGRLARVGAAASVAILVLSWIRQVVFVDADRIRSIVQHYF